MKVKVLQKVSIFFFLLRMLIYHKDRDCFLQKILIYTTQRPGKKESKNRVVGRVTSYWSPKESHKRTEAESHRITAAKTT